MFSQNLIHTDRKELRRAGKDALRLIGIRRFRVLWLRGGKERKSPWFYSEERATTACELMSRKHGHAIIYVD